MKKSFIFYIDSLVILEEMSNEQRGEFIYAIYQNRKKGEIIPLDFGMKMAVTPFINQFKREDDKYENTCNRNTDNINKRWKKENTKHTTRKSGISKNTKHTYTDKDRKKENETILSQPEKGCAEKFEIFRKKYCGDKRGLKKEFETFKKYNDYLLVIDLLEPALEREIEHKRKLKANKQFCPEWKMLQTWLNNRCWEQEFGEMDEVKPISIAKTHAEMWGIIPICEKK